MNRWTKPGWSINCIFLPYKETMENGPQPPWKQCGKGGGHPRKLEHTANVWAAIPFQGICPNHTKTGTWIFGHPRSQLHDSQWLKGGEDPPVHKWMNKVRSPHSGVNKGVLAPAAWMDPKAILLSEMHQSQKDKYYVIPLVWDLESPSELKSLEQFQKKEKWSEWKDICTQLGYMETAVWSLCTGLSCGDPNTSLNLESGGGFLEACPHLGWTLQHFVFSGHCGEVRC